MENEVGWRPFHMDGIDSYWQCLYMAFLRCCKRCFANDHRKLYHFDSIFCNALFQAYIQKIKKPPLGGLIFYLNLFQINIHLH